MLTGFEALLSKYPSIIASGGWAAAICTFLAVCVSLYIANMSRYSKVSALMDLRSLYENDGTGYKKNEKYNQSLTLSVINHGPHTIVISNHSTIAFKIPFTRHGLDTTYLDTKFIRLFGETEVLPGREGSFIVKQDPKAFLEHYMSVAKTELQIKFLLKFRMRNIKAYLRLTNGCLIPITFTKALKKFIKNHY